VREIGVFEEGATLLAIRERAFAFCMAMEEIAIPGSVEAIGRNCFAHCERLERCDFASLERVRGIGEMVFETCFVLKPIPVLR
jgi:hypothetical protein